MIIEGDTSAAYCDECKRETVWTFVQGVFHNFWKCLDCGAVCVASARDSVETFPKSDEARKLIDLPN